MSKPYGKDNRDAVVIPDGFVNVDDLVAMLRSSGTGDLNTCDSCKGEGH